MRDCVDEPVDAVAPHRGDEQRLGIPALQGGELLRREQVALVEDDKHGNRFGADLTEDLVDRVHLLFAVLVGRVDDLEEQVRAADLGQG